MSYDTTCEFDPIENTSQQEVPFNELCNAVAPLAMFGVNQRDSVGLRLKLYGGIWPNADGTLALIATQTIALTASATNYVYATVAGVVTPVTSAPVGWPGPLANAARALYQLTVGADAITSGTCYVVGGNQPGPPGLQGPQGPAGDELYLQRKRITEQNGDGAGTASSLGFNTTFNATGPTGRSVASTSLTESVTYEAFGGTGVGGSGQYYSQPFCFFGNAAGRGGFDITFQFCFESSFSSTNGRRFIGLYDVTAGIFGNVEPDTILNIIGIGSKAGDANLSIMQNDGSGSATMSTLGANFPALATSNMYELRLVSVANSGVVTYTVTNASTGNTATGTLSTNLPANTQFLGWMMWTNTGSQSTTTTIGFMKVTAYTRY